MAPRSAIGSFGFPSPRGCVPPSEIEATLAQLSRVAAVLCGALSISVLANVIFAYMAVKRADVIPYVADGGVFGCEVGIVHSLDAGS